MSLPWCLHRWFNYKKKRVKEKGMVFYPPRRKTQWNLRWFQRQSHTRFDFVVTFLGAFSTGFSWQRVYSSHGQTHWQRVSSSNLAKNLFLLNFSNVGGNLEITASVWKYELHIWPGNFSGVNSQESNSPVKTNIYFCFFAFADWEMTNIHVGGQVLETLIDLVQRGPDYDEGWLWCR